MGKGFGQAADISYIHVNTWASRQFFSGKVREILAQFDQLARVLRSRW